MGQWELLHLLSDAFEKIDELLNEGANLKAELQGEVIEPREKNLHNAQRQPAINSGTLQLSTELQGSREDCFPSCPRVQ